MSTVWYDDKTRCRYSVVETKPGLWAIWDWQRQSYVDSDRDRATMENRAWVLNDPFGSTRKAPSA